MATLRGARTWSWAMSIVLGWALLAPSLAGATIRLSPNFMIFGDVEAQNLFRMRRPGQFNPVQQRNTLRLGVEYKFIERGATTQELGGVQIPGIRSASFYALYRGVYDSVYSYAPGGNFYDLNGERNAQTPFSFDYNGPPIGSLNSLSLDTRNSMRFPENRLREVYIDFKGVPLSIRAGRQQIVWGETDNFRLLDRVNALNLTWHLQQEIEVQKGWDRIRIPYYMIKALYRLDEAGPIRDAFLEGYWNPGDWVPNKRGFYPDYPWSIPLPNPISPTFPNGLAKGTTLFRQGDYSRDPWENSQFGLRFAGFYEGVNFTVAYFHQRWNGDDGSNSAFIRALSDPAKANEALMNRQLPAEAYLPYTNTVGFSANYFEENLTQTVYKTEMVYVFGVPFADGDKRSPVLPSQLFGVSKRPMWQGMVGFDRPTWIRFLNERATWLILGQFFWHYLVNNPEPGPERIGFVGNLSPTTPLQVLGTGAPCNNPGAEACKAVDLVRDWEALVTLAATSFYRGGTVVPQFTYILDPVNSFNMEVFGSVDWYVTPNFIVNLAQRYFINTISSGVYETWGVGGINRGRSETQIRLTYQF